MTTVAIRSALTSGRRRPRAFAWPSHGARRMRRPRPAHRRGGGALPGGPRHACELLQEGVHPAHQAVPGRVPLLHLRARAAGGRAALSVARGGAGDCARGAGGRLQGGAVHAGRSAGAALCGGARGSGRAGRGVDAALSGELGGAGAEGDRAAAAPQSRRDGRGLAQAPAQGVGVAGHHAGDGVRPAVGARGSAFRLARQGAGRAPCHLGGGGPRAGALHDRHSDRHRRDAGRAHRGAAGDPRRCMRGTATSRRSSSRTSAPSPARA